MPPLTNVPTPPALLPPPLPPLKGTCSIWSQFILISLLDSSLSSSEISRDIAGPTNRETGLSVPLLDSGLRSALFKFNKEEKESAITLVAEYTSEITKFLRDTVTNRETKVKQTSHKIMLQQGQLLVDSESFPKSLDVDRGTLKVPSNIKVTIGGEGRLIFGPGSKLKLSLSNTLSGGLLEIGGGNLIIEDELNAAAAAGGNGLAISDTANGSMMMSLLGNFNISESNCNQSYTLFEFETINGTFDNVNLPEPEEGCAWNTSQLYTQGILFQESDITDVASIKEGGFSQMYVYPSPVPQGEKIRLGVYYGSDIKEEFKLTVYIFDILGQLHVKHSIDYKDIMKKEEPSIKGDKYNYFEIEIEASQFHHMSVGAYSVVLEVDGKVVGKTKLGVKSRKK